MTQPPARHDEGFASFFERFEIDDILKRIEGVSVFVTVLGPGAQQEGFAKREQIREAVGALKGVTVCFPEDEDVQAGLTQRFQYDPDRSFTRNILLLANISDVVMALEAAEGVRQEIAQLASYPYLRHKLILLRPQEAPPSAMADNIRQGVDEHRYSQADFESCDLARNACPHRVRERQIDKCLQELR